VVGRLERLGDRAEPPIAHLDLDLRVIDEVRRPVRPIPRRDEDRPVRLLDEADGDGSRESAAATAGGQPGDLALEEQVAADIVRQRVSASARQRVSAPPRCCQDLPSVWVDGA
jgi:hypothetical protein